MTVHRGIGKFKYYQQSSAYQPIENEIVIIKNGVDRPTGIVVGPAGGGVPVYALAAGMFGNPTNVLYPTETFPNPYHEATSNSVPSQVPGMVFALEANSNYWVEIDLMLGVTTTGTPANDGVQVGLIWPTGTGGVISTKILTKGYVTATTLARGAITASGTLDGTVYCTQTTNFSPLEIKGGIRTGNTPGNLTLIFAPKTNALIAKLFWQGSAMKITKL